MAGVFTGNGLFEWGSAEALRGRLCDDSGLIGFIASDCFYRETLTSDRWRTLVKNHLIHLVCVFMFLGDLLSEL